MGSAFQLELSDLHWLKGSPPERDLCAHGAFTIRVNGAELMSPERDGRDWSAWAAVIHLLRTLEADHPDQDPFLMEQLIPCCGHNFPGGEFLTCPVGIDWKVYHLPDRVSLSDFVKMDLKQKHRFNEQVAIPLDEYRRPIVVAARQVERFYEGREKVFEDSLATREDYEALWTEMRRLMERHEV